MEQINYRLIIGVRSWPILLKNSKKMEGYFSAENQNILNTAKHLVCKLISSPVGRDR